jgi:hypothetical protein
MNSKDNKMNARRPGPLDESPATRVTQVLALIAELLEAPANRFGKLEFYSQPAMTARESIRLLACAYNVGPSDTVLEQAAKVARAALKAVQS